MRRPGDLLARPAASQSVRLWGRLKRFWGPIAAIAAFGAVLSGLVGYWHAYQTVVAPKEPPIAPTPTPRTFSIAILPFASPGASAADELIARELAPDLTDAIGRTNRSIWIVSPRLAEGYANKPIDPRAVGRELNVRYLVEGKLRRTGDRLLLAATLTDAATATQIWSDKVQVANAETEGTSMALSPLRLGLLRALYDAEAHRVAAQGPAAASAMDLVIRGWNIEDTDPSGGLSLAPHLEAKKFYDAAFQLDPNSVAVLLTRAYENIIIARLDPRADREGLHREADQLTRHAVALDGDDPRVWAARGWVLAWQRQWEESLTAYQESLRIDPNQGGTINAMANVLIWSGRAEETLPWIDKALASASSGAIADLLQRKCRVYIQLDRYEEAVALCEKSAGLGSDAFTYVYLTAVYAQQGEDAKAAAAKERLLRLWPDFTLARFRSMQPSDNPVYWQAVETHLFGSLRKAGVPEK